MILLPFYFTLKYNKGPDIFFIDLSNEYIHFNYDICYRYEISSVPLFENSKLNLHVQKDGQFFNIFECFSFY